MQKGNDYVTKSDLKDALGEYDTKAKSYRDQILTGLDKVMKELEEMREDNSLGVYQTRNLREDVDGHEKRIAKLEAANS